MHKILLAEDDTDMRRFLSHWKTPVFQVSSHDNGLSAYSAARGAVEMLLTDIVMPRWTASNWRAALGARSRHQDHVHHRLRRGRLNSDSERRRMPKVLSKPVHLRELVSEVNKMLAA